MMTDKDLTDDVLDEIIAGAKTSMEQYLALSLKAERAANRQQSQQQNIPENIPVNTPCKEAPEHIWLQTAGVWPENGEFSELTWCSHNQHHDDTLYVRADLVNGNSPVTPDGWISCSERMPNDKQYVWCWGKSYGWTEYDTFEGYYDWSRNKWWAVTDDGEEPASKVTHWMPLPEPPQEVK
ncbi:Eaa prophage protein [Escherichia coli]|nr:Eaa prophage protein [Escherichia coli]CAD6045476.1 Eaa prophage protein [Escherichia coli]CAD6133421.1 Eaa prophage protein [Escherichia coli]